MYIGDYVRLRTLSTHLPKGSGYILDCGCGQGLYQKLAVEKGYKWVGVDVKKARLNDFVLADAPHLPFKDECFSASLVVDVLEHLTDDLGCLKEVHRVLKKGGKLLVHTPHWPQHHFFGEAPIHPNHVRQGYGTMELKLLIREAGFSDFMMDITFRHFSALAWDIINYTPSIYQIADLDEKKESFSKGSYGLIAVATK